VNDLSSAVTQLRDQNDTAALRKEIAALRRQGEELRALLPALRAEAAALREENAWQKRWIKELREAVATLTGPEAA
jgi:predicted  nucleic acid-binding Zn-ribbon protein